MPTACPQSAAPTQKQPRARRQPSCRRLLLRTTLATRSPDAAWLLSAFGDNAELAEAADGKSRRSARRLVTGRNDKAIVELAYAGEPAMRAPTSAAPELGDALISPAAAIAIDASLRPRDRRLAGNSVLFRGGLSERFLERALPAGRAGDRQLRRPSRDAARERCGALAARDLDRCALTDLGEQPGAVLLR